MDDAVPLVAFMPFIMVIAVVWIVFHYRRLNRTDRHLSGEDQAAMERMIGLLEKMEGRIATLEKILDAEDPRWREKVPPTEHL
jgi:phage shock protein B